MQVHQYYTHYTLDSILLKSVWTCFHIINHSLTSVLLFKLQSLGLSFAHHHLLIFIGWHVIHQENVNLLSGFCLFFDLPRAGKPNIWKVTWLSWTTSKHQQNNTASNVFNINHHRSGPPTLIHGHCVTAIQLFKCRHLCHLWWHSTPFESPTLH